MGSCKTYAKDSVCTEFALGWCTVKSEHFVVECALIKDTVTLQSGCNHIVYVGNGLQYAFTAETILVAVAKLKSLIFTG